MIINTILFPFKYYIINKINKFRKFSKIVINTKKVYVFLNFKNDGNNLVILF